MMVVFLTKLKTIFNLVKIVVFLLICNEKTIFIFNISWSIVWVGYWWLIPHSKTLLIFLIFFTKKNHIQIQIMASILWIKGFIFRYCAAEFNDYNIWRFLSELDTCWLNLIINESLLNSLSNYKKIKLI